MASAMVLQTDFGTCDGAVSAMYGVAMGVSPDLRIFDLTHEIPPYDIWEASYRLIQTLTYWPEGTVFVSVVDPGVGTDRLSVVVRTANNRYVVTPDNGTLTHVMRMVGVAEARVIDERVNRLAGSGESYTFYGRDVYAYTGARLAAGIIDFAGVGPSHDPASLVQLPVVEPTFDGETLTGTIDVLDVRFGSLWTNISRTQFAQLGVGVGERVEVTIEDGTRTVYQNLLTYARSFADVFVGEAVVYVNSLDCMAVAINQGSFAKAYGIGTGGAWRLSLRKAPAAVRE